MAKIHNEVQKEQLALHLASGEGVAEWARAHGIPDRTAYSWSRSPEVRDRTESIRRAVLAEAVKQLGAHAAAAAGQIVKLAENAQSEAVRLRAVLAEFMSVSNYTSMAGQLADIERRLRESSGFPVLSSQPDGTVPPGDGLSAEPFAARIPGRQPGGTVPTGNWQLGKDGDSCSPC
jgi:transposase-like protein